MTLRGPNSGGHVAQTAPRLALARKRRASRGCWGDRRRRCPRARPPGVAGPRALERPAPEVAERELYRRPRLGYATIAMASVSSSRPTMCSAKLSRAPGTTRPQASPATRGPARTACASESRRTPRPRPRSPRDRRPTTARARRSRGTRAPAPVQPPEVAAEDKTLTGICWGCPENVPLERCPSRRPAGLPDWPGWKRLCVGGLP